MSEQFIWGHSRRYNDYPTYIKKVYGGRVQKISVNVGFSCPNRDGSKGTGGCIYCDNKTFKPGYCESEIPVKDQILKGVDFFEKKYPDMKFMAYFQSYTNTYAPVESLKQLYIEALQHPKVASLIIGTRPDCMNNDILAMLKEIAKDTPVTIEFGLESTKNSTLEEINRCHTWEESVAAIKRVHAYGIAVGAHLILGLPGENDADMLAHAKRISALPIKTLKLHQLQVIRNTLLAQKFEQNTDYVKLFDFESYLGLVIKFVELLNPNIIIERFVSTSPIEKLIAPHWNKMKNFEIVAKIEKELERQNTYQGRLFTNYSEL
ncbi:MAG: TIGR01212 family radical SAM protein [Salinivirgaceae bacterium]|jgi:radical SAM protein (TIGR01212 family)|nr:TIGR01212 family radical SAM protein [Salinivirgaceae bacterium]